jgi:hypothetical protein
MPQNVSDCEMNTKKLLHNLSLPRIGPLIADEEYRDTKDPCPVYDGKKWHIYGSGGSSKIEVWNILHATAPQAQGPWKLERPADLDGVTGPAVAAPSVVYDFEEGKFHMFVQTHYAALDTKVEHLVSEDGNSFIHKDTALYSLPSTREAGIYDPHSAEIAGEKYLTYSGHSQIGRPDIYLAVSTSRTWYGPWQRIGRILSHNEIEHHNQFDHPDYEWGLEGSQLIELPNGLILLNAVCFLPQGRRGTRQRVFFAVSKTIEGPYLTIGPVLNPVHNGWESGENGHATGFIDLNLLYLFYQARAFDEGTSGWSHWSYGLALIGVHELESIAEDRLSHPKEAVPIEPELVSV